MTERVGDPAEPDFDSAGELAEPGTPRWVKIFALVAALVVTVLVTLLLLGGHSPGRHAGSGRVVTPTIVAAPASIEPGRLS